MSNNLLSNESEDGSVSLRNNPPLIMNAKELSAYLGISERKIRSDAAQGILPSVRIGGRVIFRLKDVDCFLEKRATQRLSSMPGGTKTSTGIGVDMCNI